MAVEDIDNTRDAGVHSDSKASTNGVTAASSGDRESDTSSETESVVLKTGRTRETVNPGSLQTDAAQEIDHHEQSQTDITRDTDNPGSSHKVTAQDTDNPGTSQSDNPEETAHPGSPQKDPAPESDNTGSLQTDTKPVADITADKQAESVPLTTSTDDSQSPKIQHRKVAHAEPYIDTRGSQSSETTKAPVVGKVNGRTDVNKSSDIQMDETNRPKSNKVTPNLTNILGSGKVPDKLSDSVHRLSTTGTTIRTPIALRLDAGPDKANSTTGDASSSSGRTANKDRAPNPVPSPITSSSITESTSTTTTTNQPTIAPTHIPGITSISSYSVFAQKQPPLHSIDVGANTAAPSKSNSEDRAPRTKPAPVVEVVPLPTRSSNGTGMDVNAQIPGTLADDITTSGLVNIMGTAAPKSSNKAAAIAVPIVVGIVAILVVAISLVLVYRRKRRHRKENIIKYKRHSQNGEAMVPLTTVSNDNYRGVAPGDLTYLPNLSVSAHEEAVVYTQVDKAHKRPPRPIYRYKTEDTVPLNHSTLSSNQDKSTLSKDDRAVWDDDESIMVDNEMYESSPLKAPESPIPPKVPTRKSSSDSQASSKRTPGSPRKDISWPIPIGSSGSPSGSLGSSSPRQGIRAPPVPPSPRRAGRPVPPSPQHIPPTPPPTRPIPPTPPSPYRGLPQPPSTGHEYDPVYVPSSDANAINRRLDKAGYVTSRRMRMNAPSSEPYEEVRVYSDTAHGSLPSTGIPSSPSSIRTPSGGATGPSSPASIRTRTDSRSESDSAGLRSGDRSFDTLDTSNASNKVNFSLEDISNIIDDRCGAQGSENGYCDNVEAEYSAIAGDSDDPDNDKNDMDLVVPCDDSEDDGVYETVDF